MTETTRKLRGGLPPDKRPGRRLWLVIGGGLLVVAMLATVLVVVVRSGTGGQPGGEPNNWTAGPSSPPTSTKASAGDAESAATKFGWGVPTRVDEFDGPRSSEWDIYEGKGHNGHGVRSPSAISVSDGILTITGDSNGRTGGLAWMIGQKYGRWEARMRAPVSDASYHALLLLWPDAEDWPVGGEVDFVELTDPNRQKAEYFLHYGADNSLDTSEVSVDATQWHDWAVEWTPDHIAVFVDGREWYRTTDTHALPPRKMHLTIQLDWFPEDAKGPVKQSSMQVDWVKQYELN